jgi:hypothetical protein
VNRFEPPDIVLPVSMMIFFICTAFRVGLFDFNKPANPATIGVAMDVPDMYPYSPSFVVE